MIIIAIDIGTYSVKFSRFQNERRKITLLDEHEVILSSVKGEFDDNTSFENIQLEVIKQNLSDITKDTRIIFQIPYSYVTARYLSLPVSSTKEAEQTLPFQLEQILPYPAHEVHYCSTFDKVDEGVKSITCIAPLKNFEIFYHKLEQKHITPHILCSEFLAFDNFSKMASMSTNYAILDIGHTTTKGYFFADGSLISNQISHVAGLTINNVISNSYSISMEEAVIYKHDNCFLLTEQQYSEVSEKQKEFAKIMHQTFIPLIQDFKRWELGVRIKFGIKIDKIYLIGGSSNILNIENYLTNELGISTEHLYPAKLLPTYNVENESNPSHIFYNILANSYLSKDKIANLLTGKYSNNISGDLPLHSTSFISYRVGIISALLLIALVLELFLFLKPTDDSLNRSLTKTLKSKTLNIPKKTRRDLKKRPERIVNYLEKKKRSLKSELSSVKSISRIDSTKYLIEAAKLIAPYKKIIMKSFKVQDHKINIDYYTDSSDGLEELKKLKKRYNTENLLNLKTSLKEASKTLTIRFEN